MFALSELKIARETNSNLQAAMENSRQENAKEVKRAAEEADRRWTMEDGRWKKTEESRRAAEEAADRARGGSGWHLIMNALRHGIQATRMAAVEAVDRFRRGSCWHRIMNAIRHGIMILSLICCSILITCIFLCFLCVSSILINFRSAYL